MPENINTIYKMTNYEVEAFVNLSMSQEPLASEATTEKQSRLREAAEVIVLLDDAVELALDRVTDEYIA